MEVNSLLEKAKTKGGMGKLLEKPYTKGGMGDKSPTYESPTREYKTKPKGVENRKYYMWDLILFDKDTGMLSQYKFSTIKELNEITGLNLTNDLAYRLHSKYRADLGGRNGENSFVKKYGHIKLQKIKEFRNNKVS